METVVRHLWSLKRVASLGKNVIRKYLTVVELSHNSRQNKFKDTHVTHIHRRVLTF